MEPECNLGTEHNLTREGVAARLGVSLRTIDAEIKAGRLPHLRFGRRVVIPVPAIEQFELERAMAAVRPAAPTMPTSRVTRRRRIVQPVAQPAAPPARTRPVRPVGGDAL